MARLLGILCFCLALAPGGPATAEREVHVVAVGKGRQTDDFYALPEARVLVDRPGREVGLVLLDGGIMRWRIEATEGTRITEIVRSGPGPEDSAVMLSGIPVAGVNMAGLPLVFGPRGRDFRTLVETLADRMGTERLHSFHATHQFHGAVLRIDRVDSVTDGLARDYLSAHLAGSGDLPAPLRRWLESGGARRTHTVAFDRTGIGLTGPDGTRRFPVPPDVPGILLPVTGTYDPASQTIYALTRGAEGYLYAVDAVSGAWSVRTSLHGYDAAALLFDPEADLLIATGAFSRPGDIRTFGADGAWSSTFIPATAFPGFSDLFDFGNEHGPPLTPLVHADGWVLLAARAERRGAAPGPEQSRIYAVRLETGAVRLLRYRNE